MNSDGITSARPATPYYFHRDGDAYVPSIHTANPWMADAIAGGPVASLIGEVIQTADFDPEFAISRTTLDIFGKIPSAPLIPRLTALRAGKQMQLHRIELLCDGRAVVQSHVLLVRKLPTPECTPFSSYAPPETLEERAFFPGDFMEGAVRTRPIEGGIQIPGRGVTWIAMEGEVVAGVTPSPFVKACLFSDYGNGIGNVTLASEWTFANLDITMAYLRMPRGEWLLLDSATVTAGNGHGLARTTFADMDGVFAYGHQTTFVGPAG